MWVFLYQKWQLQLRLEAAVAGQPHTGVHAHTLVDACSPSYTHTQTPLPIQAVCIGPRKMRYQSVHRERGD